MNDYRVQLAGLFPCADEFQSTVKLGVLTCGIKKIIVKSHLNVRSDANTFNKLLFVCYGCSRWYSCEYGSFTLFTDTTNVSLRVCTVRCNRTSCSPCTRANNSAVRYYLCTHCCHLCHADCTAVCKDDNWFGDDFVGVAHGFCNVWCKHRVIKAPSAMFITQVADLDATLW